MKNSTVARVVSAFSSAIVASCAFLCAFSLDASIGRAAEKTIDVNIKAFVVALEDYANKRLDYAENDVQEFCTILSAHLSCKTEPHIDRPAKL